MVKTAVSLSVWLITWVGVAIHLLKMTSAQVVEMSATTNNISSQDYTSPEDQPTTNGDRIPIDVDPGMVHGT